MSTILTIIGELLFLVALFALIFLTLHLIAP